LVFFVTQLSGCSTFDIVNNFGYKNGSEVIREISYGPNPRQQLDIYKPTWRNDSSSIIVFFYGGAWDSGSRKDYEFVARKLAILGHYVVIPDYRIFPQVVFPEFVEDGAVAVSYVLDNALKISDASLPVFIMGHSAGAHIAMSLGLNQNYLSALGHSTKEISGVIGLSGPYNFLPLSSERLLEIFPDAEKQYQAQPINFVDAEDPPVFLGHGDADKKVWPGNSISLSLKLKESGVPHTLLIYRGVNHSGTLKPFIKFLDSDRSISEDVIRFIEQYSPQKQTLER